MSAPSIAGDTTEGSTLIASPGTWAWRNGTFTYAWQRCDPTGANCDTIAGATAATFALGSDDVGSTIRVLVGAPGLTDTTTVAARATDVVQRAAPVNLSAPVVTGNAVTGAVLTAAPGTWSDPSASFVYTWDRCSGDGSCLPIAGAGGNTYRVGVEDLGSLLRVTVSATNASGIGSASSTPGGATTSGAPTLSAAPSITGDTTVGSTLTLSTGSWSDSQATLSIAWRRCAADGTACTVIDGATTTTYTLTSGEIGSTIGAVVIATNAGGSTTATSTVTATISDAPAPPAPPAPATPAAPESSVAPSITGDTTSGSTLTVSTGTWSDPQATLGIAWQRCAADGTSCTAIDGATGSTYTLGDGDVGSTIEAVVTATNGGGSNTAGAGPTAVITAPAPAAEPIQTAST
jgi:hypothetical protein